MTHKRPKAEELPIPEDLEHPRSVLLHLAFMALLVLAFFMLLPRSNRPGGHVLTRFLYQLLAIGTG